MRSTNKTTLLLLAKASHALRAESQARLLARGALLSSAAGKKMKPVCTHVHVKRVIVQGGCSL